jgi:hypothetical protein
MSVSASGKFASSMTFDKRGYVRAYVIPANPQSAGQGDVRQKLASVQAVLKLLITTAVDAIKAASPTSYRWNSNAVKLAIGPGGATYDASLAVFTALGAPDKAFWDTAFAAVIVPDITYKTDPDVTSGGAAFVVATALFNEGIITSPAVPAAGNYAAWATALVP